MRAVWSTTAVASEYEGSSLAGEVGSEGGRGDMEGLGETEFLPVPAPPISDPGRRSLNGDMGEGVDSCVTSHMVTNFFLH